MFRLSHEEAIWSTKTLKYSKCPKRNSVLNELKKCSSLEGNRTILNIKASPEENWFGYFFHRSVCLLYLLFSLLVGIKTQST